MIVKIKLVNIRIVVIIIIIVIVVIIGHSLQGVHTSYRYNNNNSHSMGPRPVVILLEGVSTVPCTAPLVLSHFPSLHPAAIEPWSYCVTMGGMGFPPSVFR